MDIPERIALLRALRVFAALSDEKLSALAERLEPVSVEDGKPFISEGAKSDGLYFVLSGRVRIAKRLAEGGEKDLAFVGAGECLGEMEILRGNTRSASAYAQGRVELFRLKSDVLKRWLDADAAVAARFFAELAETQSARLRRSSDEVALLYDLAQLLLASQATARELLSRAIARVIPHLDGDWSAEARAYNPFEDEMELAARLGPAIGADEAEPAPKTAVDATWTDDRTIELVLRAPKRPLALLRLRAARALSEPQRFEAGRTLSAVSCLLASALENIEFRNDEALRERLRQRSGGSSL